MKKVYVIAFSWLLASVAYAQVGLTQSVLVNVKPNSNGTITLTWPKATFTGKYNIYKNASANALQFTSVIGTALSTDSTWTDNTFTAGSRAEYAVVKVNASNATIALGYIEAGNKTKEIPTHGSLILVIDSNYILPLATEITQLTKDLEIEGYPVYKVYAGRNEKPQAVKDRIKVLWEGKKPTPQYLYLLGRIPVPYSGDFTIGTGCASPMDGHPDHSAAWPADVFYSDFEGFWTDNSVNSTSGTFARHHNIPGDGKYDQCAPASAATMKMGRVDLSSMPDFAKSDTLLVKQYLNRSHSWRINAIPFVRRGLVDDNFTGLDLSSTGWSAQSACMRVDSIFQRDYFSAQNAGNYWWSYGCGGGYYNSCSGVGNTSSFTNSNFNNIFTSLAGSYFGDWDATNSFLRAPLAAGSLCSFWGGIPRWYIHYFGLGMPLGHSALITQNSTSASFNGSQNKVHIALMGDPTLTALTVPPAGKLSATSSNSKVNLSWTAASGDYDGYCIYRIDTVKNSWFRVNTNIITTTNFEDAINWNSGKYKYAVRTIRLDTTGSGSYYVLGGGSFAWVNHTNSLENLNALSFEVYPNPSNGNFTLQMDWKVSTNASYEIADLAGRIVKTEQIAPNHKNELNLTIGYLQDGIYLVTLIDQGVQSSVKIQIQH